MHTSFKRWMIISLIAGILLISNGYAQDEDDDLAVDDAGVKRYGVIHNVAEDRRFERIGGKYEPEGLDKYIKRQFDDVFSRLDRLESTLSRIQSDMSFLQASMKHMEKKTRTTTKADVGTSNQ